MRYLSHALFVFVALALPAPAAHAVTTTFVAHLSGTSEVPPNASPGTGFATVVLDTITHLLQIDAAFSGLTSGTTASHIHCCAPATSTAMVATTTPSFAGFPLGVTSGTFANTLNLTLASSYNPAFITAHGGTLELAEAALIEGLLAGLSYFNIHTSNFSGG